jgi:Cu(I)/Ag(I) efflux system membrane protein CusA/SilA
VLASGTGSEIMQRIAAPMVGGMITAPLLSMFVVPAVYLLMRRRELRKARAQAPDRQRTDYETA